MPIYEYRCSACGHRTDILHGVHDPGPVFCPECGAERTMRKAVVAPAVHFKGSGWAKKERRSSPTSKSGSPGTDAKAEASGGSSTATSEGTASGSTGSSSDAGSD
jgi:putative FmdB family regulatory protein